jgi:hypothetical protein
MVQVLVVVLTEVLDVVVKVFPANAYEGVW